jgi:hypothetical protein
MTVYKITDPTQLEKLVTKRKNRAIIPAQDGNGDLIIGPEVLADPKYADLDLRSLVEEIEHVPLPTDEKELEAKFEEFRAANKLITYDIATKEVLYGDYKITVRSNEKGDESTKEDTRGIITRAGNAILTAGASAVNWVKNLFTV